MPTEIWTWAQPYLLAVNGLSFLAFSADKFCAIHGFWRTPEVRLLLLAALGGTPAAYAARRLFRHKTHKQPFSRRLHIVAWSQLGAALIWLLGFT
ncbi:DUF1294 domain-containing protein [Pseudophaeobacter leonis]|uniref:DUF1294 domain-containing protein n=1 Tax=Pseudophaeobacter leonis TaxID=1144477 RepID=UPI0009F1C8C6|nr:DUF1294 domain-containing protein [Pseudophaeobacter leonis]